jgi:hypothetical protein
MLFDKMWFLTVENLVQDQSRNVENEAYSRSAGCPGCDLCIATPLTKPRKACRSLASKLQIPFVFNRINSRVWVLEDKQIGDFSSGHHEHVSRAQPLQLYR